MCMHISLQTKESKLFVRLSYQLSINIIFVRIIANIRKNFNSVFFPYVISRMISSGNSNESIHNTAHSTKCFQSSLGIAVSPQFHSTQLKVIVFSSVPFKTHSQCMSSLLSSLLWAVSTSLHTLKFHATNPGFSPQHRVLENWCPSPSLTALLET